MSKFYRNDKDGTLKVAALQAAVQLRDAGDAVDDVLRTADHLYDWLTFSYDDGIDRSVVVKSSKT